jgi:hypothetical protein
MEVQVCHLSKWFSASNKAGIVSFIHCSFRQIVIGTKWLPLTQNGNEFQGNIILTKGTLQVCAKFPSNSQYDVLLQYVVQ